MICVHPDDCADFSTNGNGPFEPASALVAEPLNGEYMNGTNSGAAGRFRPGTAAMDRLPV